MASAIALRSRRRLTIGFAMLGLAIAAAFFAYFDTDPPPSSTTASWAGGIALVLCPGSLLFVTAIDIEPSTVGFALMWLVIGLINTALYAAIGVVVGGFVWKSGSRSASPPS